MLTISAADVDRALTFERLVETLRAAFAEGAVQPVRHQHMVERREGAASALLLMPAWSDFLGGAAAPGHIGVKLITISPDNNRIGKPAVVGVYLLLDGTSGEPLAMIDGPRLTQWRTAAASALASTYLSREESSRLLVIGAGAMAPFLARAHAAVRPIRRIRIWNRTIANAEKIARELAGEGFDAEAVADLDPEIGRADIVSAATISPTALVKGELLSPGTHVDLVGAFTPQMRESDDEAVRRSRIYVDTRAGALKEAGDLVQPLEDGTIAHEDIAGELAELCRGEAKGRQGADEITLFKSVGAAIEDLAGGIEVYRSVSGR
jgi:ornithine cyclodeaminase/alanine dehydrogenase-like protein (mu-crystallin family)